MQKLKLKIRLGNVSTFWKWFVTFMLITASFLVATEEGIIKMMVEADISRLSVIILGLFFGISIYTGMLASEGRARDKRLEVVKFFKNHFFTLGILGTIIGLIWMTNTALVGTDTKQIIAGLKEGLGTSLFTTAAGIITSVLLHVQIFILEYDDIR